MRHSSFHASGTGTGASAFARVENAATDEGQTTKNTKNEEYREMTSGGFKGPLGAASAGPRSA